MLHPTSIFARFQRIAVWLAVSLVAGGLPSSSLGQSPPAYKNVTNERLTNPEPRNWLMYRGSYDSMGYSALDQINTNNVSRLVPAWTFSTGMREGHQAPPVVNEGVMFVTTPHNRVLALDARSGDLLWRYDRELPEDQFQMHPTNRGVALYADRVYLATADCYLVALDARTGEEVWEREVEDYTTGYYMTLAPLVAEGKVMVGVSGGEFGIRGFVAAFDAMTGEAGLEDLHDPCSGRARQRNLGRRQLEDRRCLHLDHGLLRPAARTQLLGYRQRRPLDGRHASRRQSLRHLCDRAGRRNGRAPRPPPVSLERLLGLGRSLRPAPAGLSARGANDLRPGAPRPQRLPLVPRARARPDRASSTRCLLYARTSSRASTRRRGGPATTRRARPAPARTPSSAPRSGAARTGRPRPTARKSGYLYIPANENLCGRDGGQGCGVQARPEFYMGVDSREGSGHRPPRECQATTSASYKPGI